MSDAEDTNDENVLFRVSVTSPFVDEGTQYIRLEIGDVVDVLLDSDEDGMYVGSCNGTIGYFPASHVTRIEDTKNPPKCQNLHSESVVLKEQEDIKPIITEMLESERIHLYNLNTIISVGNLIYTLNETLKLKSECFRRF